MKCPLCNKEIPNNTVYYREYFQIIVNLEKSENNEKSFFMYKKILKNMENNISIKLCACIKNIDLKRNLLKKDTLKEQIIESTTKETLLKHNGKFNIIKSKLPLDSINDFLSEEKYVGFLNHLESSAMEYDNLKLYLNDIIKNNKLNEYKNIKNIDILNIFNVNTITEINSKYEDIDNNIINLIKYRIEKKLTTNFIFKAITSQTKFSTIIGKMPESNIKKFYSSFNENFELSIDNSIYMVENIFYDKNVVSIEKIQEKKVLKNTRVKKDTYKEELAKQGLSMNGNMVSI